MWSWLRVSCVVVGLIAPASSEAQSISPIGILIASMPHGEYLGLPVTPEGVRVEAIEAHLDLREVRSPPNRAVLTLDYRVSASEPGIQRVLVPCRAADDCGVEVSLEGAALTVECPDVELGRPWSVEAPESFPSIAREHFGYRSVGPRTCVVDAQLSGGPQRLHFVATMDAQRLPTADGVYADHRVLLDLAPAQSMAGLTALELAMELPAEGDFATAPEGTREGSRWHARFEAGALPAHVAVVHEDDQRGYQVGELGRALFIVLFLLGVAIAAHGLGAAWVRRGRSAPWFALVSLLGALLAGVVSVGAAWVGEYSYDLGVFVATGSWRERTLLTGLDLICMSLFVIMLACPLFLGVSWAALFHARRRASRERPPASDAAASS